MQLTPRNQAYKPTFHETDDPYSLPNDNVEHDRLTSQHRALLAIMGGRTFHAPVIDPKTVADLGCGSAVVTRELADKFPAAQVYGVDLSKPPDDAAAGRANIAFIQGNMKELLAGAPGSDHPLQSIDYAFQRLLLLGMTDWPGHVKAVAKSLRSGGWVEMQDYSWDVYEGDEMANSEWPWQEQLIEAGWKRKGLDLRCGAKIAGWMRDAGLVEVQSKTYRCFWGAQDVEARPDLRPWREYVEKYWIQTMHILIPTVMGIEDPKEIEAIHEQMTKDFEASWTQRKNYRFTAADIYYAEDDAT